jgi:hypothetical protein
VEGGKVLAIEYIHYQDSYADWAKINNVKE